MDEYREPDQEKKAREVLLSLADQLIDYEGEFEQLVIENATPDHYMVRIYKRDVEDYDAFQVLLNE